MNSTKRTVKDAPKSVDSVFLDTFLKQTVEDFCPTGKTVGRFKVGDSDNHCAHFVSHVLGFRFGELCVSEKWYGDAGRTMRVDELFMWCSDRGFWASKPIELDPCLIFATVKSNVVAPKIGPPTFGSAARKHVGIWTKGLAYNYHNGKGSVEGVAKDGVSFFENVYGKVRFVIMDRYRFSTRLLIGSMTFVSAGVGAATIVPGDPRYAAIIGQLLQAGATPMINDPSCPGIPEAKRRVALGKALAGAFTREGAEGTPMNVALTCADTPSSHRKDCRFVASSTSPEVESSSGVSFDLDVPGDRIVLSTLRCTVTP